MARVEDCSWPPPGVCEGLVPSPVERREITLVNYSCH